MTGNLEKELKAKDHELSLLRAEVAVAKRVLIDQKRLKEQLVAARAAVRCNEPGASASLIYRFPLTQQPA